MSTWSERVDAVFRGNAKHLREISLGRTPAFLRKLGLGPYDLIMSTGKLAKSRRDHPEVSIATWHGLPALIANPNAAFLSPRRDGSIVVAIAAIDADGCPIIVPITADRSGQRNVVLTAYGKDDTDHRTGHEWIQAQIETAQKEGAYVYVRDGFAGSQPQPGSAVAIPSSSGPIPVDGPTKPGRNILTIARKVKNEPHSQ